MPKLYMLIGVPGSGKSTWISKMDADNLPHIASSDNLIQLAAEIQGLTYDDIFHDTIKHAEKTMYELIQIAVDDDRDIIWDQTNLNRKTRAKKLIMIPDHYEKIAVWFPVPSDLNQRLANRPGKTIPFNIVNSMIDNQEYPEIDEGFDRIIHHDQFDFINKAERTN